MTENQPAAIPPDHNQAATNEFTQSGILPPVATHRPPVPVMDQVPHRIVDEVMDLTAGSYGLKTLLGC